MLRLLRTLGALAAIVSCLYACSAGGSGSAAGSTPPMVPAATHFRTATSAERAEARPSLSAGKRIAYKDEKGNTGYFTLVNWLTTDDNLDFATSGKVCDASLTDAQWYVSLGNFSLPNPSETIAPCVQNGALASGNLYIVRVGIGFFDLSIDPLSGPADASTGMWVFTPLQKSVNFQFANIYTFFVASWSGSNNPPNIYI